MVIEGAMIKSAEDFRADWGGYLRMERKVETKIV